MSSEKQMATMAKCTKARRGKRAYKKRLSKIRRQQAMKYLYIVEGLPHQRDDSPTPADIANCFEGYVQIIRFENGVFEEMTPIDETDTNNWTEVGQEP